MCMCMSNICRLLIESLLNSTVMCMHSITVIDVIKLLNLIYYVETHLDKRLGS